jgi:outer membrane immunogenic protein
MKYMGRTTLAAIGALFTMASPVAAQANSDMPAAEVTFGSSAGTHDLGIAKDVRAATGVDVKDRGGIFGGFIAVDFPVSDNLFIGAEGNGHVGNGAINSEYGGSARFGYRMDGGTKIYVRGGYQWVNIDYAEILNVPKNALPAGLQDNFGEYLVGGGVEYPMGKITVRINVDTLGFDTIRTTGGIGLRF